MRRVAIIVLLLAGCSYDYERLRVHDADGGASGGPAGVGGSVGAAGAPGTAGTIGTGAAGSTGGGPTGTAGASGGRGGGGGAGGGVGGQSGTTGVGGVAGSMAPTGGAGATATAGTTGTAGRGGTTGSAGSSGTAGTTGSAGTSGGAGTATQLTVKLKGDPTATQWMWADLQITNIGASAIPMSDLTVRYWYTFDTTPIVTQADQCGYANTPPGQCTNITRSWFAVSPARTNADYYLQIGFAAAAGNLNPGATAEFDLGWHKNDWTNFTQANDYSYNGATAFTTTSKVTVYRQGVLVYGMEPSP